jgi:hypothetical protein
MPRFILLYHDCPPNYARPSHWDLMLEAGDTLRTWALQQLPRDWAAAHARTVATFPQCPVLAKGNKVAAEKLGDHRRDYLEYEGELSGNRGRVIRVADGVFVEQWETRLGWCLLLDGTTISVQIELDRESDEREWLRSTPI